MVLSIHNLPPFLVCQLRLILFVRGAVSEHAVSHSTARCAWRIMLMSASVSWLFTASEEKKCLLRMPFLTPVKRVKRELT